MTSALRHLAAIILLPGTVTIIVPIWIARRFIPRLAPWRGDPAA